MYKINPVTNIITSNSAHMHETTIMISVEFNPATKEKQHMGLYDTHK